MIILWRPDRRTTVGKIMTRGLLAVLLALSAVAARGEWKVVAPASDATPDIAFDAARVAYEPPLVTAWTRVSLREPATLGNGLRYRSVLQKVAVDCPSRTWAVTRSEFFGSPDATGAALFTDSLPRREWELRPARADSPGDLLIRALCTTPRPW